MNKKEFLSKWYLYTYKAPAFTTCGEEVWQWIEEYGKQAKIGLLESIKTEILFGQDIIPNSELIRTTLRDIDNRIKKLSK